MHEYSGDDTGATADRGSSFRDRTDLDIRHIDHDSAMGQLAEGRGRVAGADVGYLAKRVKLQIPKLSRPIQFRISEVEG
jgi:hypothetical protein